MKNQWINRFTGYMKMKVSNTAPEFFLNECVREGIMVWDVSYQSESSFTAYVLLDDLWKLKKMAKHIKCKIEFLEKRGLPFVVKRISARKGMVIGFIACLVSLVMLSNMVWDIEIKGATPALEHEVKSTIDEMGIKRGRLHYFLPTPEQIQEMMMNEMEELTWVGVTRQGASIQFQVVEKEVVEEEPAAVSGHLVASRKAVIHDLFVEKGKVIARPNQVVEKGDLLVSGTIGKEGKEKNVSAQGTVIGEFWYKADVNIPLKIIIETITGDINRDHFLVMGDIKIPIWGFRSSELDNTYEETFTKSFELFNISLPFSYQYTNSYELEILEDNRLKETAYSIAKKEAEKKLLHQFSDNAEILGEKVLHQAMDDGKVRISIHFRIIDDIAIKQPIIQGD